MHTAAGQFERDSQITFDSESRQPSCSGWSTRGAGGNVKRLPHAIDDDLNAVSVFDRGLLRIRLQQGAVWGVVSDLLQFLKCGDLRHIDHASDVNASGYYLDACIVIDREVAERMSSRQYAECTKEHC